MLVNPWLCVEVPSTSTGRYDHDGKLSLYRSIPTLIDYLIVDPRAANVKLISRVEAGWSLRTFHSLGESVRLESVRVDLVMRSIYRRVEVTPPAPHAQRGETDNA